MFNWLGARECGELAKRIQKLIVIDRIDWLELRGSLEGPRRIAATHALLQVSPSHQLADKTMRSKPYVFVLVDFN